MKRTVRILVVTLVILSIGLLPVSANSTPRSNGPTASSDSFLYLPAVMGSGQTSTLTAQSNAGGKNKSEDTSLALVQLKGDPLSTSVKTKPPQGKKIDFNSDTVKSYRAQLAAERNDFKAWLRANAPKAKVTGEFDISLNAVSVQLNGESLQKIASAPQVELAQYEGVYTPTTDDPDLSIIQAMQAWTANGGSVATAGEGVKVAIVDTGIDIQHPCFFDTGYATQKQLGDPRYTNNKVIVAKVFNNKTPSKHYTPEAIQDHGTHVAGTVACNYGTPATVDGVTIPYDISGVAPRALLGNYNIFPGDVLSARSEDILNALEAAYQDGMDVANMSLGGNASGIQDLLTMAVDNLDEADMVVAVAAGNSGPGHYTVESPGSAARALTAGASTVPHFVGAPITIEGDGTYGAASGDFATVDTDLTAPLGVVWDGSELGTACSAISQDLTNDIALISRGTCSFSTKIRYAQDAGAVAAIIVNNAIGDPVAMASDGTPNQPTIPAYMISLSNKDVFMAADGSNVTIGAAMAYFVTDNVDYMAAFSGQGPTDVDFRVKPDVVAPGVNVLSSIPISYCDGSPCFAFFQGTSMATPHLAGSAAVVKWEHPDWSAAEIRSAIVNTAEKDVLKTYDKGETATDVNVIGAGRENLLNAVNAVVALDPVSISFGAVPSGSGQTRAFDLTLTNLTDTDTTYDLEVGAGSGGVSFSLSSSPLTLAAGESGTVTVTMTADKGAAKGGHQAWLTVSSGGSVVAHAAVYTFVK